MNGDWRDAAACKGKERHFFPIAIGGAYDRIPPAGSPDDPYAYARTICAGCPVADACLAYALDLGAHGQVDGLWAGLDEHQRRQLLNRTRPARKQPDHGTAAGYKQHRRLGEDACSACTEANRVRMAS